MGKLFDWKKLFDSKKLFDCGKPRFSWFSPRETMENSIVFGIPAHLNEENPGKLVFDRVPI